MRFRSSGAIARPTQSTVILETSEGLASGQLEVNVIFTRQQATAAALKAAAALALDLGACVWLQAPIVVPYALPLEKPLVPVGFTTDLLSSLVCEMKRPDLECTVHLHLCRDRFQTLTQVLKPNSLVVIAGRRRWYSTEESRLAKRLRSAGYQVLFIDVRKDAQWDCNKVAAAAST
jgi:hypothetical protein